MENNITPKVAYVEPYIVWVDGLPVKKIRTVLAKDDVQELRTNAAAQPYFGDWDPVNQEYIPDPRYEGMSKIEVAIHKQMDQAARGDINALEKIEDRMFGKPKVQVESLQISATLEEFLEKVAVSEGLAPPDVGLGHNDWIEGEVVGSSPSGRSVNDLDI